MSKMVFFCQTKNGTNKETRYYSYDIKYNWDLSDFDPYRYFIACPL